MLVYPFILALGCFVHLPTALALPHFAFGTSSLAEGILVADSDAHPHKAPIPLTAGITLPKFQEEPIDSPVTISAATLAIIDNNLNSTQREAHIKGQAERLFKAISLLRSHPRDYCEPRFLSYECPKPQYNIYASPEVVERAKALYVKDSWFRGVAVCARQGDLTVARFNSLRITSSVICYNP